MESSHNIQNDNTQWTIYILKELYQQMRKKKEGLHTMMYNK